MIKEFGIEKYLKEIKEKNNKYLSQFGFIPLSDEYYEQLMELFNYYDLGLDKFNEGFKDSNFIDLVYFNFDICPLYEGNVKLKLMIIITYKVFINNYKMSMDMIISIQNMKLLLRKLLVM